jgi:hypothetical protein
MTVNTNFNLVNFNPLKIITYPEENIKEDIPISNKSSIKKISEEQFEESIQEDQQEEIVYDDTFKSKEIEEIKNESEIKYEGEDESLIEEDINIKNNLSKFSSMIVENQPSIEICSSKEEEEDEEFDYEAFKFFEDFCSKYENDPIKEKVEKILEICELDNSVSGLSNKMKNEIMRNLKSEYLFQLEILNSKFET